MSLSRRLVPSAAGSGAWTIPAYTYTPGSPATWLDDARYNAFPLLVRAANGDALLFYRRGTDHNVSLNGQIMLSISSDDGATWGTAVDIHSDVGVTSVGPQEAVVRASGDIVLTFCTQDGSSVSDNFIGYTLTSTDHGATWGDPVATGTTYGTAPNHREVPVGIVELADTTLLCAMFVRTNGATKDKIVSFTSADDGATWGSEATIVADADSWSECRLVRVGSRVHAFLRNDTDKDLYRSYSDDGGATWSTPALLWSGWGFPRARPLAAGHWIMVYRKDDGTANGRAVYRTVRSITGTWSAEANLETSGNDMQYADVLETADGSLLCVYSLENSSSDADIDVITFART